MKLALLFVLLLLIGVGGWRAFGVFVARARGSTNRPKERSLLATSVLALLLLGAGYELWTSIRDGLGSDSQIQSFDAARWNDPAASSPADEGISVRQRMLADVIASVLPGRERRELEEMLGPSLDTPYFASTGRDLIYLLGRERDSIFGVDSEWLLIWLNASGRFERHEVRTD